MSVEITIKGKSGKDYRVRVNASPAAMTVGCHTQIVQSLTTTFGKSAAGFGWQMAVPTVEEYDDIRSNPEVYKAILDATVTCVSSQATHLILSTNMRYVTTPKLVDNAEKTRLISPHGTVLHKTTGSYSVFHTWDTMQMIMKLKYGAYTLSHVTGNRNHPKSSVCVTMVWTPPAAVADVGAASPWKTLPRKGLLSFKEFRDKFLTEEIKKTLNCGIGDLSDTYSGCLKSLKPEEKPKELGTF